MNLPESLASLVEVATTVRAEDLSGVLPPAEGGRAAAVLLLFWSDPEAGVQVLLIERSSDLRRHAGQPAFPGGVIDPDDTGPAAAALRETVEETGLDPAGVEILATLPDLYIPVSDYVVTPVLAWWRKPSAVAPVDVAEVAAVHLVKVADLVDPANRLQVRHRATGTVMPAFRVNGMLVWGFTAGLLDRLLRLSGWERPWSRNLVEDLPDDVVRLAMRTFDAATVSALAEDHS
ncbi:MAG TPA: CoA pyrophosphatase [Sporichthyaceae bacterium]|nr:CoA pyrophosphatase [Sporichthyaceae bacterium]